MGSDTKNRRWSGLILAGVAAASLVVACNTHPAEFVTATGAIEKLEIHDGGVSPKLDILWMIDNSGSMCQEQKALRDNFGEFIDVLAEIDLDFHIGITTTHFITPDHKLGDNEPVALPGHLQLTPQPLPGFDRSCYYKTKTDGSPDYDAPLEPILDAIYAAIDCTKDPAKYESLKTPNMDELRCSLDAHRWRPTLNCPKEADLIDIEDYFPDPADYRVFGKDGRKFLRADDYRNEDRTLRVDELRKDFSCASMVGMRGYGFEQGLAAIVKSVDPELTGGPDGVIGEFPNAGFLRTDARTGIIIVTDENDCSHNGKLDETDSCGSSMCEMSENMNPSPLLSVSSLKEKLMMNLTNSMGLAAEVTTDDVIVASIHGPYQPYLLTGPHDPNFVDEDSVGGKDQCLQGYEIPASCASLKGIAFSGHRYDRFMRQFTKVFPEIPKDPEEPIQGLICDDFGDSLKDIANLFRSESGGCITDIFRCEGADDTSCPAFAYSGDEGSCRAYPQGDQGFYCDSGVQVRIQSSGSDAAARLEATGYCEPGSIDTADFPNGCVVKRSNYRWDACPGDGRGVLLEWEDTQVQNILSGMVTQIRYAILPPKAE